MAERDEVLGMKVIILDRDNQKLEFLKSAVLKARPDASVRLFQDTDRLLEAVRDLVPDVAFLRIEMEPLNGIILGRVLSGMFPKLNLIFMADSNQYAADAIKLRPSGYLSEPITEEIIGEELSRLRYEPDPKTRIKLLENQEVMAGEKILDFKYSKTRTLMKYLIVRNGTVFSTDEIEQYLWQGDRTHKSYLRNILADLSSSLKAAGCEDVLIRRRGQVGINMNVVRKEA